MSDARAYQLVLLHDVCVYCHERPTGLDHIEPRASYVPGPNSRKRWHWMNSWENRAPACMRCDNAKGNRSLLFFLLKLQRDELPAVTKSQARRAQGLFRAMARQERRQNASVSA